jgi:hypothetical protein
MPEALLEPQAPSTPLQPILRGISLGQAASPCVARFTAALPRAAYSNRQMQSGGRARLSHRRLELEHQVNIWADPCCKRVAWNDWECMVTSENSRNCVESRCNTNSQQYQRLVLASAIDI